MIVEELLYSSAPVDVQRLTAQQDVERERRNTAGVLAWHVKEFGPVAGPQLAAGASHKSVPLTPSEITRLVWRRYTESLTRRFS